MHSFRSSPWLWDILACATAAGVLTVGGTGPSSPCLCTDASIFTGQTYCFDGQVTTGSNGSVTGVTATPECSTGGYVTCAGKPVELPAGTTQQYYPDIVVTGEAMNCTVADFLPSPLAAPVSIALPQYCHYNWFRQTLSVGTGFDA